MRRKTTARQDPSSQPEHAPGLPPPILRAFEALAPSDLYQMAPKESVVRGFDYYRRHRLRGYEWSRDRSELTARVEGTRLYAVTFSVQEDVLFAECDCPAWDPGWQCKHVLCASFTTKNLLSPGTFLLPRSEPEYREALEEELLGAVRGQAPQAPSVNPAGPPAGVVEIIIDARHEPLSLAIRHQGFTMKPSSGWFPRAALPQEVVPLLNHYYGYQGKHAVDPLATYLKHHADAHPLLLQTRKATMPLRFEPAVKVLSKTVLEVAGDEIIVRAACLADGVEMDRFLRFRSFVIDVNGGRLIRIEDEQGWGPFFAFRQETGFSVPYPHPSGYLGGAPCSVTWPDQSRLLGWQSRSEHMVVKMPLEAFRSVQIDVLRKDADRVMRDLILKVNGTVQAPVRRAGDGAAAPDESACRLLLTPPSTGGVDPSVPYRLRAECRWRGQSTAPSAAVFGFFPFLEHGRHSAPLKAWKRRAVMMAAYVELLSVADPKEQDQRLRRSLDHPDFRSRGVRQEAQWAIQPGLEAMRRDDLRLELDEGRWVLRPIERAKEAALYRVPCEVFGPEIFRGAQRCDEMTVPASLLYERLPVLLEKLTAAGVSLLYEDKPIRPAQWDVSVEVGRGNRGGTGREGSGIDWFEIRSEIRCDGVVLEERLWREAARRGGLIETGDVLRILDASTLERLRALLALAGAEKAARGEARVVTATRLAIFDWLALREQGVRVSLPEEDEAVLSRLADFKRIPRQPLPVRLQANLRPYQEEGYAWLVFLYQHRFGACLADDMGLGKTLQAICLLAAIRAGLLDPTPGATGPHLVVVPTSLLFNWEQEIARFYPDLTVRPYTGTERTLDAKDGEVVLTTYGLLRRDIETLAGTTFHVIIFDEAQAVKNLHADTTAAARRLKGSFKVAMTGTPVENHLGEYFSIVDLCLPGLLGDYERFRTEVKDSEPRALERLLRRTRPFVLRRTKEATLRDLPDKIESDLYLDLTDRQKALYQQTVAQVRTTIDEAYRSKTAAQAQLIALTAILKLRQVCLSPRLLTGRPGEPSPKLEFLLERLQVLLEEGHSALVFSQFTSFLDLVEEGLGRQGIAYSRLDGSTAARKRKTLVTAFQAREQPGVFLLSLKAGGQGLNLTKATYVFHLDPWWNPAVEQQASDRAHRIGQKRVVTVMRILMRHTVEEKMMALKRKKLDLYQVVVGAAVRGAGRAALTKSDFDFLLAPPEARPGRS